MRAGGGGGAALYAAICATSRVCWRCVGAKFAAFAVGAFARTIGVARRAGARARTAGRARTVEVVKVNMFCRAAASVRCASTSVEL